MKVGLNFIYEYIIPTPQTPFALTVCHDAQRLVSNLLCLSPSWLKASSIYLHVDSIQSSKGRDSLIIVLTDPVLRILLVPLLFQTL